MANVEGKFYRGETQRRGVTPVSPPNAEDDPQDPLNPPGAGNTTTYKQLGDTIDKSFVGKNGYIPVVTDENALTLQPNIPNTGVAVFGGVVYNSTTTVDIGIVKGYIVDNETDPLVSSVLPIQYAGATGVTVTTLGSGTRSYALLKSDGTIHFQNTYPTSEDRKQMIYLFKVGHPAGVITVVANEPDFVLSPLQQFRDLFQAFNYVNEGVYPYADAADLTFNTSAGLIVGNGINFVPEPDNPNILTVAATTPCTFVYRSQTGAGGGATTLIDPNTWDNAGTIDTVGGGSNRSTIQYIHYSPNLGFVIQPGQVIYDNLVDAIAAIGKEEHVVYENLIRDAILIGVLALTRSTTDLTDTDDARFFRADIFGQLVGSAAGTSVTTLQRAYLNSLIPQIETVSGELAIKNGGASDTDVVFAIRSLLDVDNIQMYGDGRIRHSDAVNSDESATLGQVIDLALGDGLISGGIVQWTGTGYNFDVSTAFARFNGVYTLISLPDTLTLTTPDATNDRIDLFILQILFDVDGIPTGMEADFITGTPAANPVKPQINPETQIELTQVLVGAGSTTPTLTEEIIYDQNTEWTGTSSGTGTAVFNSSVDPYQGSISVETTNIQNGFYIQFNNGAEIDISTYQTIGFHIKLKASLGVNQNLYISFLDGALAPVSNFVLVNLDKSLLTYQFVGIALNAVNFTSSDVQYIRVSFVRTSGSTTFSGYFFDVFKLEGGIAPPVTNSDHNQLLGLQGGNATERYHLTQVEHQRVQDFSPYDLAQVGAADGEVLTWVAANSRYEPVTPSGGSSKWTDVGSGNIYRNSRVHVGGTTDPNGRLQVSGSTTLRGISLNTTVAPTANNQTTTMLDIQSSYNNTGFTGTKNYDIILGQVGFTNLLNSFGLNYVAFDALASGSGIAVLSRPNGTPTDNAYAFQFNKSDTANSNNLIFVGGGSSNVSNAVNKHVISTSCDGTATAQPLVLRVAGNSQNWALLNDHFTIFSTGNIVVQSSSASATDAGFKLDVIGTTRFNGNSIFGTTTSTGTTTPLNVSFGGTYGTNTPGSVGNMKWFLYQDSTPANSYGIGMSASLMEIRSGSGAAIGFFTNNGVESFRILSTQDLQLADGVDFIFNTSTGTKIGTSTTQKFAFWNKTPIVQPTTAITGATLVSNAGTTITSTDTFGGYTLQQIAAALINMGALA